MKKIMIIMALVAGNSAFAIDRTLIDCVATNVLDSSYLEESLSVDEYPDVTIIEDASGSKEASLGMSAFGDKDDDSIQSEITISNNTAYSIKPSHGLEEYMIVVQQTTIGKPGELSVRSRKSKKQSFGDWVVIADLKCK